MIPITPVIPFAGKETRAQKAKRFWADVRKTQEDACWFWRYSLTEQEYGVFRLDERHRHAHRVAYALTHGDVPEGLHVAHLCRKPACCNPAHLVAVSPSENAKHVAQHKKEGLKRNYSVLPI